MATDAIARRSNTRATPAAHWDPDAGAASLRSQPRAHVVAAVRAHPIGAYFTLSVVLSWSYWIPDAITGGHWSHFPGLLGPAVAAVAVSALRGQPSLRLLLRRVTIWRVAPKWYLAALIPMAAATLVVAAQWLAGTSPDGRASRMPGVPDIGWVGVVLIVFVVNGFGEETGWRGFAWPQLRQRHTLLGSALLLTIPWALWHVPLFWIHTGLHDMTPAVMPGWFMGLACGAVVLGWLVERSGSVAVVALAHTMLNMATATDATTVAAPYASIAVIMWAMLIARRTHDSPVP